MQLAILTGMLAATNAGHTVPGYRPEIWVIFAAEVFLLWLWCGVTLTDRDAIVHNRWRRRIAWSEVQAVTQERSLGSGRLVLWTVGGQIRLFAPVTYFGLGRARFDRGFHTVGQWWLAHRGPDWVPVHPAAPGGGPNGDIWGPP